MLNTLQYGGGLFFTFQNAAETPEGEIVYDFLKHRDPKSFSKSTKQLLNLITIQEGVATPVGSQKFSVARYPGDIDLLESVEYCCSLKTATTKIAADIKTIVQNILDTPGYYLGDFKAGLDFRYIPLKDTLGDLVETGKIKGYSYRLFKKTLSELRTKRLITNNDFKMIGELAKKTMPIEEWTKLYELCKNFWTIRWTTGELLKGEKKIGQKIARKKTLKLTTALTHNTVCKLDLWAPVNERYMEITNFLITSYMDNNGESTAISPPLDRYKERLITDIKHYGNSRLAIYNPLKMAKRIWAIAVSMNDTRVLKKIYPLFSTGGAILYQIVAEAETIVDLLSASHLRAEIAQGDTMDIILKQIDGWKARISEIYDMEIDENLLFVIIDDLVEYSKPYFIIKKLKQLIEITNPWINRKTERFLKKHNITLKLYDHLITNNGIPQS